MLASTVHSQPHYNEGKPVELYGFAGWLPWRVIVIGFNLLSTNIPATLPAAARGPDVPIARHLVNERRSRCPTILSSPRALPNSLAAVSRAGFWP